MMGLEERFVYMLYGVPVGFVFGYLVAKIRLIDKKMDEVDMIVKKRDEGGWIRPVTVNGVALVLVVVFTAYAAFVSQKTSSEQELTTKCTQMYLAQTLAAVNERTTYSGEQNEANAALQRAQQKFILLALREPPLEESRVESGLRTYLTGVSDFVELVEKTRKKQNQNPYPTEEQFINCLNGEEYS